MSGFHHAFVSVAVDGIAWLIITLWTIALSHCCHDLVHNAASSPHTALPLSLPQTLFSKSFSAQTSCLCWNKGDCMLQSVFECLCLETVLECMSVECNKTLTSVIFCRFCFWFLTYHRKILILHFDPFENLFYLHFKLTNVTIRAKT